MYKLLSQIEFYAALLQGKGFGSSTVKLEVARVNKYVKTAVQKMAFT